MTTNSPNIAPGTAAAPEKGILYVLRRMRRAYLSVSRVSDTIFSAYRLTTDQYMLMCSVERTPGIRQTDLAEQMSADANTITPMVKLLEKHGILLRRTSPDDGRVKMLSLTNHGQMVLDKMTADWIPLRVVLRKYFEPQDGIRALEILDDVAARMQLERAALLSPAREKTRLARAKTHQHIAIVKTVLAPKSAAPVKARRKRA